MGGLRSLRRQIAKHQVQMTPENKAAFKQSVLQQTRQRFETLPSTTRRGMIVNFKRDLLRALQKRGT